MSDANLEDQAGSLDRKADLQWGSRPSMTPLINVLKISRWQNKTLENIISNELEYFSKPNESGYSYIEYVTLFGATKRAQGKEIGDMVSEITKHSLLKFLVTKLLKWDSDKRVLKIDILKDNINTIKKYIDDSYGIEFLKNKILENIVNYKHNSFDPNLELALFYLTVIYVVYKINTEKINIDLEIPKVRDFFDKNNTYISNDYKINLFNYGKVSEDLQNEVNRIAGFDVELNKNARFNFNSETGKLSYDNDFNNESSGYEDEHEIKLNFPTLEKEFGGLKIEGNVGWINSYRTYFTIGHNGTQYPNGET